MISTAAPIFSLLGLLLYEMATGRQAFSGKTGGAIIEAILTRTPPSVRTVESSDSSAARGNHQQVSR